MHTKRTLRALVLVSVAAGLLTIGLLTRATLVQADAGKEVRVAYPGALARVVEDKLRVPFERATGYRLVGESRDSIAMANLVKDGIRYPDVLLSADREVNRMLQGTQGNHVGWWIPFARSELVIAWNPASRFSQAFEEAKEGTRTMESVLTLPGLRLGRTDPDLDPRGYRTVMLFQLDEARTGKAGLARSILGPDRNPDQIFPEEILTARVQSGAVDAGVFYATEPIVAGLPYLTLPPEINQSDPTMERQYARAHYTTTDGRTARTIRGSAIAYTVGIASDARNHVGANAFVRFLLSPEGQDVLAQQALVPLAGDIEGDRTQVPPSISSLVDKLQGPPPPQSPRAPEVPGTPQAAPGFPSAGPASPPPPGPAAGVPSSDAGSSDAGSSGQSASPGPSVVPDPGAGAPTP